MFIFRNYEQLLSEINRIQSCNCYKTIQVKILGKEWLHDNMNPFLFSPMAIFILTITGNQILIAIIKCNACIWAKASPPTVRCQT